MMELPETSPARLAVLLSGSGRTLVNIADAIDAKTLRAKIALVVASRRCPGVDRALERGFPTCIEHGEISESRLLELLDASRIDLVVLAGYLKLVPIPAKYAGRIVNIHPALLPRHGGPGMYGDRVHRAVLDAGDTQTGCTVHLCDTEYDRGRIVLQRMCLVEPGDTVRTLADRVFALETEAYPEALRLVIDGRVGG